jgi:hypothetical protein
MVSLLSLAVPILLAAVLVFIVSSIVHMALPYHKNDFRQAAQRRGRARYIPASWCP